MAQVQEGMISTTKEMNISPNSEGKREKNSLVRTFLFYFDININQVIRSSFLLGENSF